ncbi:hypothetical protein [Paraburkholderia lycopersici]|uniref:hypothetical protein n=1 Tax=Paraburkholderia lycopersici TaxID=416944 RepID=UPI0015A30B92|nr:hypothetical protein [Paraburkholderia lycopersici]
MQIVIEVARREADEKRQRGADAKAHYAAPLKRAGAAISARPGYRTLAAREHGPAEPA